MNVADHLKFKVGGFSAQRAAYMLAVSSLGFVPVHFFVSCEASSATIGVGWILLLASAGFSMVARCGAPHRFRPMAIALIALFAHAFCAH